MSTATLVEPQEQERRTMDVDERLEQLRQRELYYQTSEADYRNAFEAGWDAGRKFADKQKEATDGIQG